MSDHLSQLVQLPPGHKVELCLRSSNNITSNDAPTQLAVLLHPWSWLGGNMNDPVLRILEQPLLERGFHVLRYNSRGVGRSKGWSSLTGTQEAQDLREIVHWALDNVPNVKHLLLIGYSHGSLITSQHPPLSSEEPGVGIRTSHILLSYPLGPRALLTFFRSKAYATALASLVRDPNSRVLLIYGDEDEFTAVENFTEWAEELRKQGEEGIENVVEGNGGRVTVRCIVGGSHFWAQGKADEMLDAVQLWLDSDGRVL